MGIEERIKIIEEKIDIAARKTGRTKDDITLVAVTKYSEAEDINQAIHAGIKVIGENRVQELLRKDDDILKIAQRHIIGHLQTNKVKYIVDKVSLIQSVDSFKLAEEINRQSLFHNRVTDILIQVNIAKEEQKFGVYEEDLERLLEQVIKLQNVKLRGLMTIPPLMLQIDYNKFTFSRLRELFIDIKAKNYDNGSMDILSMGMSRDYEAAILEGANMVRIGSQIFKPIEG